MLKVKESSRIHGVNSLKNSLSHRSLEKILQIQLKDFSVATCGHAIELFLSIHPNGDVRKRPRHIDCHDNPKNKGNKKLAINLVTSFQS